MKRRILSLVLVLALLIGAAVRPQRADAVALTASVVAASAAAILTACGVSYWAASQTDAVHYISGKIDDYLTSIGESKITYDEWLELNAGSNIFDVVSGGVMQFSSAVANKLLDFVRWFQAEEGLESGGEAVGNGTIVEIQSHMDNPFNVSYQGNATIRAISSSSLRIDVTMQKSNTPVSVEATIPCQAGTALTLSIPRDTLSDSLYNNDNCTVYIYYANYSDTQYYDRYFKIGGSSMVSRVIYPTNDYFILRVSFLKGFDQLTQGSFIINLSASDLGTENTASITPSDFVNVPADIADGAIFAVTPSVALASGDTVEEATQTILDGVTSEDGLSSTVEDTPNTAWGWLYTLLVNIAESITDGVADIKQAVLGLADSIYSKFTTILQDIKTGINTIVNSITSAVSQLRSAIQALPTTIYSQFSQILQDIKTGIQGIALDIYTDVINALTYVFVPSQAFIDTYVASLYATFDNHFSILSYPFSILGEFITRASGIGSPEPMFTWGNIYEPFSGKLLIAAGSYNLNSMLSNQTFAQVYSIYMIVVKGLISFAFLKFLYSWFCDVFKMREDDFSSPLDVED